MGFLKKLKKRGDRAARLAKAKDAKRERRAARELHYTAKHRENEVNKMEKDAWDDMQVILYTALHESYGFGGKRLTALFSLVQNLAVCVRDDYVTEKDLLAQLGAETKYHIKIEELNLHDDKSIQARAIDRITLYFFWILHDKYGFGKARLRALYRACGDIGKDMTAGKRTINGMVEQLQRIKGFWIEKRD